MSADYSLDVGQQHSMLEAQGENHFLLILAMGRIQILAVKGTTFPFSAEHYSRLFKTTPHSLASGSILPVQGQQLWTKFHSSDSLQPFLIVHVVILGPPHRSELTPSTGQLIDHIDSPVK